MHVLCVYVYMYVLICSWVPLNPQLVCVCCVRMYTYVFLRLKEFVCTFTIATHWRQVRMDLSHPNPLPARINYLLMYVHIRIYRCLEIWFVCISYVCKCMCAYIDVYIHAN